MFSCGRKFSVGLSKNGDVFAWGDNTLNQLGLNAEYVDVPTKILGQKFSRLYSGDDYTIGIASNGNAYIWGTLANELVYTTEIVRSPTLAQWESFSCGATHIIGKTTDGEFYGWGNNTFGQLNIINANKHLAPKSPVYDVHKPYGEHYLDTMKEIEKFPTPTLIQCPEPNVEWEEFFCGFRFTIGKASNGNFYISGHSVIGQDPQNKIYNVRFAWIQDTRLIPPPEDSHWKTFYIGPEHIVGMTTSNEAYMIGDNRYGELGLGDREHRSEFHHLPSTGAPWKDFYLGLSHTIGITTNGKAFAWGNNQKGRLGLLESADKIAIRPQILVPPVNSSWVSFVSGHNHVIGITSMNKVYVFGSNDRGQLGLGDIVTRSLPHLLKCPISSWAFTPRDTNYNDLYEAAKEGSFTDLEITMKDNSIRHVHSALISLRCPALLDFSTHRLLSDIEMDLLIKLCYGIKPNDSNIYRYVQNPLPDMAKLLEHCCDFSIVVGDTVLSAHKFILSTRNEYFRLHLEFAEKSGNTESTKQAILSDTPLSPSSTKKLLYYFYTTKVPADLTAIESFEILLAKDFLRLESDTELMTTCQEKFEITLENCADVLKLATKWEQEDVVDEAAKVFISHSKGPGLGARLMQFLKK